MSQARIYRPAKTAMQSGRGNTKNWVLEFEPEAGKEIDPLMGWISSRDTQAQVKLRFASKEEAIAYAKKRGIDYRLQDEHRSRAKPRSYADNFKFDKLEFGRA